MQAAIGVGARVFPATEHRADGAPQLRLRVHRERRAGFAGDHVLVFGHHVLPVLRAEGGVLGHAGGVFGVFDDVFEVVVIDAEHHAAVHLDETAIAVPGEARIAGGGLQADHGIVVQAEVQHGVHHPRHGDAGAGADGDQQRRAAVAEFQPDRLFDQPEGCLYLGIQFGRVGAAIVVIGGAEFGGDGEAGRHRQPDRGHFGEVGPLAAEQVAHVRAAFVMAGAEAVDIFGHAAGFP